MAAAGFLIELLFGSLGTVPLHFHVTVLTSHPTWNATTFLDLAALAMSAILAWRFLTTGGLQMLRVMSAPPTPGQPGLHAAR